MSDSVLTSHFKGNRPKSQRPKLSCVVLIKKSLKEKEKEMWFLFVCDGEERELGRQQAPGSCPYCRGKVQALDVERQWNFCFLPI